MRKVDKLLMDFLGELEKLDWQEQDEVIFNLNNTIQKKKFGSW